MQVFHELTLALRSAVNDDSRVVLLSASGNVFSSGIDLNYLLNCEEDRKLAAKNMATSLRSSIAYDLLGIKLYIASDNVLFVEYFKNAVYMQKYAYTIFFHGDLKGNVLSA